MIEVVGLVPGWIDLRGCGSPDESGNTVQGRRRGLISSARTATVTFPGMARSSTAVSRWMGYETVGGALGRRYQPLILDR
jgi:hypothetical protein